MIRGAVNELPVSVAEKFSAAFRAEIDARGTVLHKQREEQVAERVNVFHGAYAVIEIDKDTIVRHHELLNAKFLFKIAPVELTHEAVFSQLVGKFCRDRKELVA